MTPAQRFASRREAEKRAAEARVHPAIMQAEDSLHVKLIGLKQDLARMRQIACIADRLTMKRDDLLPRWQPVAQAYLDSGRVYQNLIFVWCIIWLFDTRQFDRGITWAMVAIEQGQAMPDSIRSNFPTFVARQIYEWAELEAESGRTVEPWFSQVFRLVTSEWRVFERLTAQYYRLAALLLLRDRTGRAQVSQVTNPEKLAEAKKLLQQAHEIYPKIQVRTLTDRISMRLRKLTNGEDE